MKKLNFVFVMLAMILTLSFCFVGCGKDKSNIEEGENNSTGVSSVLSITETKELVLQALKLDNNALKANPLPSAEEDGNRNIFVKFGTTDMRVSYEHSDEEIIGRLQKNNSGDIVKYVFEQGDSKEYFDGSIVYDKYLETYSKTTFESAGFAGVFYGFDCVFLDLLFIDDAWSTIYNEQVSKTRNDSGYDLELGIEMSNYCDFVMAQSSKFGLGAEGLFGEDELLNKNKTEGSANLKIVFNNLNQISSLTFEIVSTASMGEGVFMEKTTIQVDKSLESIEEPNWFDISKYSSEE